MTKLRVHNLALSIDGFATGEGQSLETPFGHAGARLMEWFFPTHTFVNTSGHESESIGAGTRGVDDAFAAAAWDGIGAEIMGRRKFGPQQGPWEDESWRGWWGEEPPFHTPVVVLTHHARPDIQVGETTFLFRDLAPQASSTTSGPAARADIAARRLGAHRVRPSSPSGPRIDAKSGPFRREWAHSNARQRSRSHRGAMSHRPRGPHSSIQ